MVVNVVLAVVVDVVMVVKVGDGVGGGGLLGWWLCL